MRNVALLAGVVALALLIPMGAQTQINPDPETKGRPLSYRPISFFKNSCSRCHGDGSVYARGNVKDMSVEDVRRRVDGMARGRARQPLDGTPLDAQVAHVRSMAAKLPYIAWVGQDRSDLLFEVSDTAKLTATARGRGLRVKLVEDLWHVEIGRNKPTDVRLTATMGKARADLDLSKAQFSSPLQLAKPNR